LCVESIYVYIYANVIVELVQKSTDRIFHNPERKKYSHGKFPDNGSTQSIPSPLA
jgi:hypothetical protein